jgi:hypothetical protein
MREHHEVFKRSHLYTIKYVTMRSGCVREGTMIMNSTDRVANLLIGSRGDTYCDDCIAASLTIDGRQQVRQITSSLAGSSSFRWEFSRCSVCGRETTVIRSN